MRFEHLALAPVFETAAGHEGAAVEGAHAAAGARRRRPACGAAGAHGGPIEYVLMLVSLAIAGTGIALAHCLYVRRPGAAGPAAARFRALYQTLLNKYCVDEFYAGHRAAAVQRAVAPAGALRSSRHRWHGERRRLARRGWPPGSAAPSTATSWMAASTASPGSCAALAARPAGCRRGRAELRPRGVRRRGRDHRADASALGARGSCGVHQRRGRTAGPAGTGREARTEMLSWIDLLAAIGASCRSSSCPVRGRTGSAGRPPWPPRSRSRSPSTLRHLQPRQRRGERRRRASST